MTRRWTRLVALLTLGALCSGPAGHALATAVRPAGLPIPPRTNGPLLVLDARGGMGQPGPAEARILVVQGRPVVRVVAGGLPFPFSGGIAPSPLGQELAYGEDLARTAVTPVRTDGLWLAPITDGRPRRLLAPPRSTQHNQLAIGPVAWSPDGTTLAYAVVIAAGVAVNPGLERGLGICLIRADRGKPRLLATNAQLGAVDVPRQTSSTTAKAEGSPFPIDTLSWSRDGRTLAVGTFRVVARTGAASVARVVLALDTRTGAAHMLVKGAYAGVYAPSSGLLAYVKDTVLRGASLFLSDTRGHHERAILLQPYIEDITWSPDGRALAYLSAARGRPVGSAELRSIQSTSRPAACSRYWRTISRVRCCYHPAGSSGGSPGWLPRPHRSPLQTGRWDPQAMRRGRPLRWPSPSMASSTPYRAVEVRSIT